MIFLLVVAISWFTETNSHAASARGARAYEKQQYGEAVRWFKRAQQLAASPRAAFNLGTALVAAGEREQGSAALAEAMKDPALRAEAHYNRGNSALAAKAFDHAIADYIETLKRNPRHAGAKRNLEIALARREAARTASTGNKQNKPGTNEQRQPSPAAGQKPPQGQPDLETLLRSVQQQEQEELRRMKVKSSAEGRVGW